MTEQRIQLVLLAVIAVLLLVLVVIQWPQAPPMGCDPATQSCFP